jgi:rhamnosyltransferase
MRALIVAHFDVHGIVDDYVLYALRCYRPYFDVICFSSTADLSLGQQQRAAIYADIVVNRPNVGYDFLSWRIGFEALPNVSYDEIVFVNDSCYGPCSDIRQFWKRVTALNVDLWGATVNYQFRRHVQSFCMGFGPRLIKSGFAKRFWRSVEIEPDKFKLILRFEVGLSGEVEHEGFRIGAVVDLRDVDFATRKRVYADNEPFIESINPRSEQPAGVQIMSDPCPNPSMLYWNEALRRGSPFVKVELLRDNPLGANLINVRQQLSKDNWYDVGLIDRHLERVAPRALWRAGPANSDSEIGGYSA